MSLSVIRSGARLLRLLFLLGSFALLCSACAADGQPDASGSGGAIGGSGGSGGWFAGGGVAGGWVAGGAGGGILGSGGVGSTGGEPGAGGSAPTGGAVGGDGFSGGGPASGGSSAAGGTAGGGAQASGGNPAAGGQDATGGALQAATWSEIAYMMNAGCASCHSPPNPTNLQPDDDPAGQNPNLHETLTTHRVKECGDHLLVDPGRPELSALLQLLNAECTKNGEPFFMPETCGLTPCFPEEWMNGIELWIAAGAEMQ